MGFKKHNVPLLRMKKFAVTILALVYITVSTGATVQLHFCTDKLIGWSLTSVSPEHCGKCGMSKQGHKGCCHDEQKIIKVTKDQKSCENSFSFFNKALQPHQNFLYNKVNYLPLRAALNPNSHAPPLEKQVAIFIYNCVFLI